MEIYVQYAINTLISAAPVLLLAIGLTLIFGVLDIPDFAQGALAMLSAFVIWYLVAEVAVNYFLAVLLACLVSAVVGATYYRVFYQRIQIHGSETEYTSNFIIALGIHFVIQYGAYYLVGARPKYIASPFSGFTEFYGAIVTYQQLVAIGIAAVSVVALFAFLNYTVTGKAIRAIDQNLAGAEACGIDIKRTSMVVFFIGSLFAGLAGAILAPLQVVSPTLGFITIVEAFTAVIIGGLGSVRGAIFAVLLLSTIKNFSVAVLPSRFQYIYVFGILVLVLLVRPEGLFQTGGASHE